MATPDSDIDALRQRLARSSGKAYWRSLTELAESESVQEALQREFPEGASEWGDSMGRRRFIEVMGASLVFAGLTGCVTQPDEGIVARVDAPPEYSVPGRPQFFATAFLLDGYAEGILAESHEGRPIKVEGNPDHPASLGAASAFAQASILNLYDPDRSTNTRHRGAISTWTDFSQAMLGERRRLQQAQGDGLCLLTGPVTSPTLAGQIRALLDRFPQARWYQHEPVGREHLRTGLERALGRPAVPVFHFNRAEVVLSIDADVLYTWPGRVRYAHDFAQRRRVREGEAAMSRLYVAESTPTITGAMADHRLPLAPSRLERLARAIASQLGVLDEPPDGLSGREQSWAEECARDLREQRGRGLVVAGRTMPPAIHALVHALNAQLDNVGRAVEYIEPAAVRSARDETSLAGLARGIEAGRVETLVMLGGNPVYSAPADVPFGALLEQVRTTVHHSFFFDETSARSQWHLPATHTLEAWGDARAFEGTASIIQPLIAPLYAACHSAHEVMAVLLGTPGRSSYEAVRGHWRQAYDGSRPFEAFWKEALYLGRLPKEEQRSADGEAADPERPGREGAADFSTGDAQGGGSGNDIQEREGELEIVFRPSTSVWDGEFVNNGWLQELPAPLTKLTWDNAALFSPSTAARLGLQDEDVVELEYRDRSVEAPVWLVPGHADDCVTVSLGYGHERTGRVGEGAGFSAYRIRPADAPWAGRGLRVQKTGKTWPLATTQHHYSIEGRGIVEAAPIERFRENPDFVQEGRPIELPSLYPEYEYDGYKWGMVIDQNVCIGCNACVVACQAENNVPVVGKEGVRNGREMHWLRVDRYYTGTFDNPDTYFQPVPCMHCEKAPCEVVCPVAATVHDEEGLNVMVYNRCVGTRYCSNNCPYKVRRFNFLEWNDWSTDILKLRRNPDVTVRSRGVMEKCTYCIQRISAARIEAKKENRSIRDGEILTACQQTCPTNAIVFGDLNDPAADVKHLHEQPHNYALLAELGTRPRTTYLTHFRNPNSRLAEKAEQHEIRERGLSPEVKTEGREKEE